MTVLRQARKTLISTGLALAAVGGPLATTAHAAPVLTKTEPTPTATSSQADNKTTNLGRSTPATTVTKHVPAAGVGTLSGTTTVSKSVPTPAQAGLPLGKTPTKATPKAVTPGTVKAPVSTTSGTSKPTASSPAQAPVPTPSAPRGKATNTSMPAPTPAPQGSTPSSTPTSARPTPPKPAVVKQPVTSPKAVKASRPTPAQVKARKEAAAKRALQLKQDTARERALAQAKTKRAAEAKKAIARKRALARRHAAWVALQKQAKARRVSVRGTAGMGRTSTQGVTPRPLVRHLRESSSSGPVTSTYIANSGGTVTNTVTVATAPSTTVTVSSSAVGVQGMDVSGYTVNPQWTAWKKAGVAFVWAKATEGTTFKNGLFASQQAAARANGILSGAYHFANPSQGSGKAQADFFLAHGGMWKKNSGMLPGALDMEWNPYGGSNACYGMDTSAMNSWVRDFMKEYKEKTGVSPIIYTATAWWNQCVGSYDYRDAPLWLANYGSTPGSLPTSWTGSQQLAWQNASVEPGGYDSDIFNGEPANLQALASTGQVATSYSLNTPASTTAIQVGNTLALANPAAYFVATGPVTLATQGLPVSGTWQWNPLSGTITYPTVSPAKKK